MPNVEQLVGHWGYLAVFLFVTLGNMGLPIPEETILALAGYLVWRGQLRLPIVLAVGILSAVAGDNVGYWLGQRYGRKAFERYARWVLGNPRRLDRMQGFVGRHGPLAVFSARFVPGLRFMAGPLAGTLGLRPLPFLVSNLLGAAAYVPLAVGAGYAVGYGLGEHVERLRQLVGEIEHVVLGAAVFGAVAAVGWRMLRTIRARRDS